MPRVVSIISQVGRTEHPLVAAFSTDNIISTELYLDTILQEVEKTPLSALYSGPAIATYRNEESAYHVMGIARHIPVLTWRLGSLYLLRGLESWATDDFSSAADYFEWQATTGEKKGFHGFPEAPLFVRSHVGKAFSYLALALQQLCRIRSKFDKNPIDKDITYHTYYYMSYAELACNLINSDELTRVMNHARVWHSVYSAVDVYISEMEKESMALFFISNVISGRPDDFELMQTLYIKLKATSSSVGMFSGIKKIWTSVPDIPSKTFDNPPNRIVINRKKI